MLGKVQSIFNVRLSSTDMKIGVEDWRRLNTNTQ